MQKNIRTEKTQAPEHPATTGSAPLVSVLMLAYKVGPYIAEAIEGVLRQKTGFPFELVIGEDRSPDNTRLICEQFQDKHPGIVRVLPAEQNLGIAGNAARTLARCRGRYIAICDGDDVWQDAFKLQKQIDFLEQNPDYGLSYSDVITIDEHSNTFADPEHEALRPHYAQGEVFIRLLDGNFINNSTAVVRRSLLEGHHIDTDRNYYIHDYLMWLHVAVRCKVHFVKTPTTAYRKHSGGVTNSEAKTRQNSLKFQLALFSILHDFARSGTQTLRPEDKVFLFRKTLSLLYRKAGSWEQKVRVLPLLLRFFPGLTGLWSLGVQKIKAHIPPFSNKKLVSNLKEYNS